MLRALDLRAVQRPAVIARQPARIFLAAQPAEDEDAARRAKMKQLFGIDEVQPYKPTRKEREEEAKREALRPPSWQTATPPAGSPTLEWRAGWLTLWLQDSGVNMDSVLLVEAEEGLVLVTSRDVPAGATLFDIPDKALLTVHAAYADPNVGRDLRIMASQEPGAGFEVFAIATLLAAERVRRGSVAQTLKRREGGLDAVLTTPLETRLQPKWSTESRTESVEQRSRSAAQPHPSPSRSAA